MYNLVLLIYAAPLLIIGLCLKIMGIGSFKLPGFRKRPKAPAARSSTQKASQRRRGRSNSSSGTGSPIAAGGTAASIPGMAIGTNLKPPGPGKVSGVQDRSAEIIRKGLNGQIANTKQETERLRAEQRHLEEQTLRNQETSRLQEEARLREELERVQEERRREEERVDEERRRAYS